MDLDAFVQAEIDRTGKRVFTLADVCRLTQRWIEYKTAAAAPFPGWEELGVDQAARIDALLGIQGEAV